MVMVNPVFLILSWALPLRRDSCLWGMVIGSTSSEEEKRRNSLAIGWMPVVTQSQSLLSFMVSVCRYIILLDIWKP